MLPATVNIARAGYWITLWSYFFVWTLPNSTSSFKDFLLICTHSSWNQADKFPKFSIIFEIVKWIHAYLTILPRTTKMTTEGIPIRIPMGSMIGLMDVWKKVHIVFMQWKKSKIKLIPHDSVVSGAQDSITVPLPDRDALFCVPIGMSVMILPHSPCSWK